MFKLMKKSEYDFLMDIKRDYDRKGIEWKKMQQKLTEKEKFVDRSERKCKVLVL